MIITADTLVFGPAEISPLKNGAILIESGIIRKVDTLEKLLSAFPEEEVVQYQGSTLMPGLIDMHTHTGYDGAPNLAGANEYMLAIYAASRLHDGLLNGVTTARDVGSLDGLANTLKAAAKLGYIEIPRLLSSNNGICMTGGHGADMFGMALECDGEWEIRKAVRLQHKKKADWIKVLTSEGYRGMELSQEELNAAVDEAHRLGLPIAVHSGFSPSVAMSIEAGFDTIEHGTALTVEGALTMKKNNQTWVPTLTAFMALEQLVKSGASYRDGTNDAYALEAAQMYRDNFKKLYDTGVRVAAGTDMVMPGLPALPVAKELYYMVELGLTPLQAIETATLNSAVALRLENSIGQIKEKYFADIIVVQGDATKDISALEKIVAVYQDGKPIC